MNSWFGDVWITRLLIQRGMAAIYLIAFIAVLRQFKALLGEHGLLPVPVFLKHRRFLDAPGIFVWRYSDRLLDVVGWTGLGLSVCALGGITEAGPIWLSVSAWLGLWFLYLSIVNAGQTFFAFGWESMLLEAGFFTAFLGPSHLQPSILPILILRWMLFRTEVGAGLIKLRHDPCWRDLTCLYYHYETQPMPNPLSWYFHRLPRPVHRVSALFSHFVQVIVPFALFAPQPVASIAGGLIIFHQLWLIISGNYSWLNWLTVALGITAFSDPILALAMPIAAPSLVPRPLAFSLALYMVAAATTLLSIPPVLNLFSRYQLMNTSYNRFHLVNAYGAFGSVGRKRYEIVLEGTDEPVITPATVWREYSFNGKPGDLMKVPSQIAPYHLRLDWVIWFLPFSVSTTGRNPHPGHYELWFLRLVKKLLTADPSILNLMGENPFPERPPARIRALLYHYRFTTWAEKRGAGAWWARRLIGAYLPPISAKELDRI